jgi:magnesium-transporting ATPase (P-type)
MGTNNFNIKRLYLLIQRQVVVNQKNLLISFAACFGATLTIFLLVIYGSGSILYAPLMSISFSIMFTGGLVFTSLGFKELHSPAKAYQYLTLPATTFEKLLSVWLLTSILHIIVSLLLILILALLGNLFALAIGVGTQSINELLHFGVFKLVWIYFVVQTVFLLGSCYFRKNNFLKTLLALFILGMVLSIYAGINGVVLFHTLSFNMNDQTTSGTFRHFMQNSFPMIMHIVFYYLTAPFFLVVSYFVLKERQV